jgi:hypothetical protein
MKPSPMLTTVAIATLAAGCVASAEPREPEPVELDEPAPPPVAAPVVTPKAGVAPKKGGDEECPPWACGSNHNRRIVRLAAERT